MWMVVCSWYASAVAILKQQLASFGVTLAYFVTLLRNLAKGSSVRGAVSLSGPVDNGGVLDLQYCIQNVDSVVTILCCLCAASARSVAYG